MAHHRDNRRFGDREWSDVASERNSALFADRPRPATVLGKLELIPATADKPRRVYFTDPVRGTRWRVYDAVFGPPDARPFEQIAYPPPRVNARERLFFAANGERRAFSFNSRHGPRSAATVSLNAQAVTDQFLWSGFPASTLEEERDSRRDFVILPLPKWVPTEQHGLRSFISNVNRWTAFDAD